MDPALAGLIGVGVGGLLSFLTEERRAWADRRAAKSRSEREMRTGVRLVEREWLEAMFAVGDTIEYREWWDESGATVTNAGWDQFAPLLAGSELDEEQWDALTLAAGEIDSVNRLRQKRESSGDPITMDDYARLVGSAGAISEAVNVLRTYRDLKPYSRYEPPKWYEKGRIAYVEALLEAQANGEPEPRFESFFESD